MDLDALVGGRVSVPKEQVGGGGFEETHESILVGGKGTGRSNDIAMIVISNYIGNGWIYLARQNWQMETEVQAPNQSFPHFDRR